jgi:outer membrane receptor for Fe3+-dicitrate
MNNAMKDELEFAIDSFVINRFSSNSPKSHVRKERLNFQIQHLFKVDAESNIFEVGFRVQVMESKQSKHEIAAIETITSFKIKGLPSENFNHIPEHLVITFLSIAYSTTRGALVAKSQGSVVGEVPLPLINPSEVIARMKNQQVMVGTPG